MGGVNYFFFSVLLSLCLPGHRPGQPQQVGLNAGGLNLGGQSGMGIQLGSMQQVCNN